MVFKKPRVVFLINIIIDKKLLHFSTAIRYREIGAHECSLIFLGKTESFLLVDEVVEDEKVVS